MASSSSAAAAAQQHQQVLGLTSSSLAHQQAHEQMLMDLKVKQLASTLTDIPTLPLQVRAALRRANQPVRLFGENLAQVRDRLRLTMARQQLERRSSSGETFEGTAAAAQSSISQAAATSTQYTRACPELIAARQQIARVSLKQAEARLARERELRNIQAAAEPQSSSNHNKRVKKTKDAILMNDGNNNDDDNNDDTTMNDDDDNDDTNENAQQQRQQLEVSSRNSIDIDRECQKTYDSIRHMSLQGSQYADVRGLAAIASASVVVAPCGDHNQNYSSSRNIIPLVATASWTGHVGLWHGGHLSSVLALDTADDDAAAAVGNEHNNNTTTTPTQLVHEDRCMALDLMALKSPISSSAASNNSSNSDGTCVAMLATASLDKTAKVFKVITTAVANDNGDDGNIKFRLQETVHLQGHQARCSRIAFHPLQRHVATTSWDHAWRLWDMETGKCILLQDGHWKPCYGIDFSDNGAGELCATTDLSGVVHMWDLRTGKSILHWNGTEHAGRVLNADFVCHGDNVCVAPQLATSGDDGTIQIWDLRRMSHTNHNTNRRNTSTKYSNGKVSSSPPPLASIPAHSGLITRTRFAKNGGEYMASSSFDGTVKLWSTRGSFQLLAELNCGGGGVTDSNHSSRIAGKVAGVAILDHHHGVVTCGFDRTLKLWK